LPPVASVSSRQRANSVSSDPTTVLVPCSAVIGRSRKVADRLAGGIEFLFKKNKVEYAIGSGVFAGGRKVEIRGNDGSTRTVEAAAIIIATGSEPTPLPGVEVNEKDVVSSTGALALKEVPKRLLVVGGGYIGLVMGSVWRRLGSQVTVVEYLDRITPGLDGEVGKQFQRLLTKQGMAFKLGMKVELEHSRNPKSKAAKRRACSITLDHLAEFDRYYTKGLLPMERRLKKARKR
jgi:dihydrolipoamide dehydrogenase